MIANTVLNNLAANLKRLEKQQNQMSTGQIVSKPSDNPAVATRVLNLNSVMMQHEQYDRNMSDAQAWLETTDNALGNLGDVLQEVRGLAVQGASDTLTQSDRDTIVKNLEQIKANIVQIANTTFADRYIFAGTKTPVAPFAADGSYGGNDGQLNWEVSPGVTIAVNIDGVDAFIDTGVFTALDNLIGNLQAGDTAQVSSSSLAELDTAINGILNLRAAVGAKSNRMETALSQSSSESINYEELLSKLNDVDMAKLVIDLEMQSNVYEAALSTAAKIIQPSLVNFLS